MSYNRKELKCEKLNVGDIMRQEAGRQNMGRIPKMKDTSIILYIIPIYKVYRSI